MSIELTAAYLALGAKAFLVEINVRRNGNLDAFEGEQGFMDRITSHSPQINERADAIAAVDGMNGVFQYDIVEPMGYLLAKHLYETGELFADTVDDHLYEAAHVCGYSIPPRKAS